eukprot:3280695-Pyramimonas_sp.AAC.3
MLSGFGWVRASIGGIGAGLAQHGTASLAQRDLPRERAVWVEGRGRGAQGASTTRGAWPPFVSPQGLTWPHLGPPSPVSLGPAREFARLPREQDSARRIGRARSANWLVQGGGARSKKLARSVAISAQAQAFTQAFRVHVFACSTQQCRRA